jgi:hypothetical protein
VILLPAPLLPDGDSANSVFPCPYRAGTFFWVTDDSRATEAQLAPFRAIPGIEIEIGETG